MREIMRTLRYDDATGNENVKNNKRFCRQNNNFARASYFLVDFFAVLHDYNVKLSNFLFREDKQATTKFYSLSILEYGS